MSAAPLTHDFAWSVLAAKPFLYDDQKGQDKVIDEARTEDESKVFPAVINVAAVDLGGAIRIARTLLQANRSPAMRARAQILIAIFEVGSGRLQAAGTGQRKSLRVRHPMFRPTLACGPSHCPIHLVLVSH